MKLLLTTTYFNPNTATVSFRAEEEVIINYDFHAAHGTSVKISIDITHKKTLPI
jgi:hypothetical protein